MDPLVIIRTDGVFATKARFPEIALGRTVENSFWQSGYLALRDVSCVAIDHALYLRGRLPSYYLKQVAQEIAGRLAGGRLVVNWIEVAARPERATVGGAWPQRTSIASNSSGDIQLITSTSGEDSSPRAHEGSP